MPGTVYFLVLLPIQFPTIAGFSSGFLAIQESAGTGRGGEGRGGRRVEYWSVE